MTSGFDGDFYAKNAAELAEIKNQGSRDKGGSSNSEEMKKCFGGTGSEPALFG